MIIKPCIVFDMASRECHLAVFLCLERYTGRWVTTYLYCIGRCLGLFALEGGLPTLVGRVFMGVKGRRIRMSKMFLTND